MHFGNHLSEDSDVGREFSRKTFRDVKVLCIQWSERIDAFRLVNASL